MLHKCTLNVHARPQKVVNKQENMYTAANILEEQMTVEVTELVSKQQMLIL